MEFSVVSKNSTEHVEFPGVILLRYSYKDEVAFPRVTKEKIMWNFQGFWFWTLEFPKDLTQFCGISRCGALFCLEFPGVK